MARDAPAAKAVPTPVGATKHGESTPAPSAGDLDGLASQTATDLVHDGAGAPGAPTDGPTASTATATGTAMTTTRSVQRRRLPSVRQVQALGVALGNRAATQVVQRRVNIAERDWLRTLLTSRDAAVIAHAARNSAGDRILRLPVADRTDTVQAVRAEVDGFEVALGTAFPYTHLRSCRLVSALEGAQPNADLGARLVTLFQTSVDPLLGLAVLVTLDRERIRAVLQSQANGKRAIDALLARTPARGLDRHLRDARRNLTRLSAEIAAPTTEGVSASSPERERRVETILTPPAIRQARARAAAAGLPPPTFVEAGYYDDLMAAVHASMLAFWPDADAMNRRTTMDTARGGHVEGVAAEAKSRVDSLFGIYGSAPAPSLTFASGRLRDQTTTAGDPFDLARWIVEDSGTADVSQVKENHHAFADARAEAIGREVASHYSNTRGSGVPAAPANLDTVLGMPVAERVRRLRIIDRMWPGMAGGGTVSIRAREGATAAETRGQYWGLFKTLLHEYLHTTAHATYTTWYGGLTDAHQQIVYQEGFTDLFTKKTWDSIFPDEITSNEAFRRRIQITPDLDLNAVGRAPDHYPEMAEAALLERQIGLANMRAAYFRGETAVLGGGRLPR